jgi:type II secretory pathway predicted ATPase ExeA
MYEQHFGFQSRPFYCTPYVDHYFSTQAVQKALFSARTAIERGTGPVIIVGAPGTGKSLLLAVLEREFRSRFQVANISCSRMDKRQEFLQTVLFELNQPYRGLTEGELRLSLLDYLRTACRDCQGMLFLIDDGDQLSIDVLDEIRLVSNFSSSGQPRARLILAGNIQIEELLGDSKMQSLNQRIAARCYLGNLGSVETAEYVCEHLHRVGVSVNQIFDSRSLQAMYELTEGCPRLINQLCDHALILAMTQGEQVIGESMLREAWADLQSFPEVLCENRTFKASSNVRGDSSTARNQENWSVIEFGSLEEHETSYPGSPNTPEPSRNEFGPPWAAETGLSAADGNPIDDESEQFLQDETSQPESWWRPGSLPTFENPYESQTDWGSSPTARVQVEVTGQALNPFKWSDQLYESSAKGGAQSDGETPDARPVAVNPFEERFDEVEVIQQRYARLVAQCNRDSQGLTSEDLEILRQCPLALNPPCETPKQDNPGLDDLPQHWRVQSLENQQQREFENTRSKEQCPDQHAHSLCSSLSQSHGEQIEFALSRQTVSHDTDKPTTAGSPVSSSPFTIKMPHANIEPQPVESAIQCSREVPEEELAQMESIRRAVEEQNRFSAKAFERRVIQPDNDTPQSGWRFPSNSNSTASSDKAMVTEPAPLRAAKLDDRDMLVCEANDVESCATNKQKASQRAPFPPTPVSTGRAERMDYEQLFNQLRNLPDS